MVGQRNGRERNETNIGTNLMVVIREVPEEDPPAVAVIAAHPLAAGEQASLVLPRRRFISSNPVVSHMIGLFVSAG